MIYNFEFTETENSYRLSLNRAIIRVYTKSRHSEQEAEDKASKVVNKAIDKHGLRKVIYNGNLTAA